MAKAKAPKAAAPAPDAAPAHHFYASTAFSWHVGYTRDEAILLVLKATRSARGKRESATTGEYVWSVRVDLPKSAEYQIRNYTPFDVPMGASEEGYYTLKNGRVVVVKAGR